MNAEIQRLGITDPAAINTLKNLAVTVAGAGVGNAAGTGDTLEWQEPGLPADAPQCTAP